MNGQSESKYTVWHFIGCGCTVLVLLGLIAVGGFIWFGKQMIDGVKAGFEDPEVRAARTQEILGYQELPEGYYPGFTMSVPFMMDMATLGDKELPAGEELSDDRDERGFGGKLFDRSGFLFVKARAVGDRDAEDVHGDMNLDLHLQRRIGEGTVEAGGGDVHYSSSFAYGTSDGERVPTISTDMEVECLADPTYVRKAVWFTPGPEDPGGEIDPAILAGTAADPEAIRAFLDHFELCG